MFWLGSFLLGYSPSNFWMTLSRWLWIITACTFWIAHRSVCCSVCTSWRFLPNKAHLETGNWNFRAVALMNIRGKAKCVLISHFVVLFNFQFSYSWESLYFCTFPFFPWLLVWCTKDLVSMCSEVTSTTTSGEMFADGVNKVECQVFHFYSIS